MAVPMTLCRDKSSKLDNQVKGSLRLDGLSIRDFKTANRCGSTRIRINPRFHLFE